MGRITGIRKLRVKCVCPFIWSACFYYILNFDFVYNLILMSPSLPLPFLLLQRVKSGRDGSARSRREGREGSAGSAGESTCSSENVWKVKHYSTFCNTFCIYTAPNTSMSAYIVSASRAVFQTSMLF